MALISPLLILRVAPGHKQQEEERGSIRDEIRKRLALAEKGDLEQLLRGLMEVQEKQKQQEKRSEGPGSTDAESDRLLRAAQAVDRGQLRTAARLLRGSKLLPPTEATADAIELLYQTSNDAQKRTAGAFEVPTHSLKSDVRQQHATATFQLFWYHRAACRYSRNGYNYGRTGGLTAFTEPWIQAKVIGGDKGGGKARPIAFEEMLL